MEDLILSAKIDEFTTLKISPIAPETYLNSGATASLGNSDGYFVLLSRKNENYAAPEVLAKAASFDAAEELFDMIVRGARNQVLA